MTIRRTFILGGVLTFVGVLYTYVYWSLAAFMTPVCDGHWDTYRNCRLIKFQALAGFVTPFIGPLLILISIVRLIRWLRQPADPPRRVDNTGIVAGRYR